MRGCGSVQNVTMKIQTKAKSGVSWTNDMDRSGLKEKAPTRQTPNKSKYNGKDEDADKSKGKIRS